MKRTIEDALKGATTDPVAHERVRGRPNIKCEVGNAQMRIWLFPWGNDHVAIMLESGETSNRTIFRGRDPKFILESMSDKYAAFLKEK